MPFTAALGIAHRVAAGSRSSFPAARSFEFLAMMSFAIPGTVIGVAYILAFNVPPVSADRHRHDHRRSAFVFRNMPVGIRAGLANLSQIDRSLDEASLTLGAHSSAHPDARDRCRCCGRRSSPRMVYSFVRAVTAVSAVIFLVTGALQSRHGLHRRPRRCRRIRRGDRLFGDADRVDGAGARSVIQFAGRRAPPRSPRRGAGHRARDRGACRHERNGRPRRRSSSATSPSAMATVVARRRRQLLDRARHAGDAARSVRLRQDDHPAADRGSGAGQHGDAS